MSSQMSEYAGSSARIEALQRPSGGFAMLAIDQREALRDMLTAHQEFPATDDQVREFKLTAARVLTPFASAVLIDRQFALEHALDQGVVAAGCGLIAAADHFESAHGELVGTVTIDRLVDPVALRERGVVALKLLVLYRPDSGSGERIAMTKEFIEICRHAGVVSIIEPVSRKPLDGRDWDWNEGVFSAAEELGSLGADLYKSEVPFHGEAEEADFRAACRRLTGIIDGPWVVLSSGVHESTFPRAVRWACEEGASGFLAGRAVWASSIASDDPESDIRTKATARLKGLVEIVDETVGARSVTHD